MVFCFSLPFSFFSGFQQNERKLLRKQRPKEEEEILFCSSSSFRTKRKNAEPTEAADEHKRHKQQTFFSPLVLSPLSLSFSPSFELSLPHSSADVRLEKMKFPSTFPIRSKKIRERREREEREKRERREREEREKERERERKRERKFKMRAANTLRVSARIVSFARCSSSRKRRGGGSECSLSTSARRSVALFGRDVCRSSLIDTPEIDLWDEESLKEVQEGQGATFELGSEVPSAFEEHDAALTYDVVKEKCVFCDRSDLSLLQVSGADRLSFLHNQSTATTTSLAPGSVVDTTFVNAKAGVLDLATLLVQENSVLVLASPGNADVLLTHLEKHIFPRDDVKVTDISQRLSVFSIFGKESGEALKQLGMIEDLEENKQVLLNFEGYPVVVARASGLSLPGYTWLVDSNIAVEAWKLLAEKVEAKPMGSVAYERIRVADGRPALGKELTEKYNPLEAGLLHCLDLDKGCSIGQETIKRIYNKKGFLRRLWGLSSDKPVEIGADVLFEGKKIGFVTSACPDGGGQFIALAYLKEKVNRKQFSPETGDVVVGGNEARVKSLEYVHYPDFDEEEEGKSDPGEKSAEEVEEEKRKKKAEMKARMEEWLRQSKQA